MATSVGESMLGCPKIQIQISNKLFNLFNYIWPKKFTKSNIQKFRKLYSHDFFLSGFYRVLSNFTVEVNMPRAPVGATKIFFNEIIIFCNTIVACERRNSRDDICILTVTLLSGHSLWSSYSYVFVLVSIRWSEWMNNYFYF